MGDMQEMAAEFEAVLQAGDFGAMAELVQEYGTDDFVEEWPQSGERLTKAAAVKMAEYYPRVTGTTRSSRTSGCSAVATSSWSRGRSTTATASRELRRDRRAPRRQGRAMTEYFANPFEAPAWRADFVERMAPARV